MIALLMLFASMQSAAPPRLSGQELRPSDLRVRETDTLKPPEAIAPMQAREDIRLLQYALEHAYGGRRFVPEEDFDAAQRQLSQLSAKSPPSPDVLCDSVADILWQIPDNHISVVSGRRTCGKKSTRRRPSVGENVAARTATESPWAVTQVEVAGRRIPVLSVTRFPAPRDPVWKGYSQAIRKLRESPAVIIDLRGNGGGNDERGQELAEALLGRKPDYFFDAIIKRQTPGSFLVLMNPLLLQQISLRREGKELPDYYREDLERDQSLYQSALDGNLPVERVDDFSAKSEAPSDEAYGHPILILVDAACASSCEDTVLYLKQHPGSLTVGQATGGYLHFGDMGWIVLPHSQLRVNLPTKHFQIRGAYYERIGIEPDIRVPPGGDALEKAKSRLAEYFSKPSQQ